MAQGRGSKAIAWSVSTRSDWIRAGGAVCEAHRRRTARWAARSSRLCVRVASLRSRRSDHLRLGSLGPQAFPPQLLPLREPTLRAVAAIQTGWNAIEESSKESKDGVCAATSAFFKSRGGVVPARLVSGGSLERQAVPMSPCVALQREDELVAGKQRGADALYAVEARESE